MMVVRGFVAVGLCVALVSCGGDDTGSDPPAADTGESGGAEDGSAGETAGGSDAGSDGGSEVDGGSAGTVADGPTVTADPGLAVVEVDGQRLEYPMAGAINVVCDVSPDYVQVNIQTPDGQSISLTAAANDGAWAGSSTASVGGANVSYGTSFRGGVVGVGDNAVSYEGPMDKVVDFDIVNAESMDGTIAVNCEPPGGNPTAEVGGESYTFAISGAQSFQCVVGADEFEIRVNRLAIEGLQLEMQGRDDGSQWIGSVAVYTPAGTSSATLPPDGAGLVIDGGTVTFDGTFTAPDGSEVEGTATATCSPG